MLTHRLFIQWRRILLAALLLAIMSINFTLSWRLWETNPLFSGFLGFCTLLFLALPIAVVGLFRWYTPYSSAYMIQTRRRLKKIDPGHRGLSQQWVKLQQIAPQLRLAVIVAEDFTFPIHFGVVWHSVAAAYNANKAAQNRSDIRGGSTITQQLVKNLFLWSARSYLRKAIELYLTFLVEILWPKRRILEVYLNIVQLGVDVFGVEAASQTYFGSSSCCLSPEECALLVAALPNPMQYTVNQPPPRMRFRQAIILNGMKKISPQYLGYMKQIGLISNEIDLLHQ